MIDAVLFDLDGTLLDRDASVRAFARAQRRRFLDHVGHIPEAAYVDRFVALDAHGAVWKDEVYRQLVAEFAVQLDADTLLDDYTNRFHEQCIPFPGLRSMLARLRADGFALGIISNGRAAFQQATVRALDLDQQVSVVLISESEGVRKPDPTIFQRAVARLGTAVGRSVYVGDNPVADVAGARAAGLRAVWKRDSFWPPPAEADAIIDGLDELPEVIGRLQPAPGA